MDVENYLEGRLHLKRVFSVSLIYVIIDMGNKQKSCMKCTLAVRILVAICNQWFFLISGLRSLCTLLSKGRPRTCNGETWIRNRP